MLRGKMMPGHAGGGTMHRKKEVDVPTIDGSAPPVMQRGLRSPGLRTPPKDGSFSSLFNVFITLLLALTIMALTGFPASLFSKPFLCRHFPLLLQNNRDCIILRTSEVGWDHLQRFSAGEIPEDKKAVTKKPREEVARDNLQARVKHFLEQAALHGEQQIPRGAVKTVTLRDAIAKQLEPWLGEGNVVYIRKDLEDLHGRFPYSVRVVVQGKSVQVHHHKQQEDNPEWATWYRGEQLRVMVEWLADRNLLPSYVEFVANLGDNPRVVKEDATKGWPPMFSYCSSDETRDVIFVGYQYTRCFSRPWHSDDACPNPPWNWTAVEADHPWESKQDQALWQGAVAGGFYEASNWRDKPRSQLVKLSLEYPEILNATFLQCDPSQCTPEANWFIMNELGYAEHTVTLQDQLKYKYLVDIDGESWSPAFFELLSTGSVVFKQQTTYREFSDIFFKPDVHYIQYAPDLKDLPIKIMTALEMDEHMKKMGKLATETARAVVETAAPLEYVAILLKSYAKLLQKPETEI